MPIIIIYQSSQRVVSDIMLSPWSTKNKHKDAYIYLWFLVNDTKRGQQTTHFESACMQSKEFRPKSDCSKNNGFEEHALITS